MNIKKRTAFGYAREIAVANNLGLRISLLQVFEQEPESGLLFGSTSVSIAATGIHTTNVTYADGVLVVVTDMGSCECL